MAWHLSLPPDVPIVEITYVGDMTLATLKAALQEALVLAARSNRQLWLSDLYFLADALVTHHPRQVLKEAVLLRTRDQSNMGLARFWEITADNRGHKLHCFDQRESTLNWLSQA